jgi:hypothetical protein
MLRRSLSAGESRVQGLEFGVQGTAAVDPTEKSVVGYM